MGYFSNPKFMYIQDYPYNSKEIDNFIVRAYKNGKVKVVGGYPFKRYVVKKEIERIKKYRNIRLRKPIPSKKKKNTKSKSKSKRNSKRKSKGRYFKN